MRDGERDVGDGTLPGVGGGASAPVPLRPSSPVITGGHTATMPPAPAATPAPTATPAPAARPAPAATPAPTVASVVDARVVKQRLATDPTLPGTAVANADQPGASPADKAARHRLATDPTLASDESEARGLGETLAGPHIAADLPALQRIDDTAYAIGEELARGGMGKILFARDRRLRRDVVIKVTHREPGKPDPRFEREALITARLQHPSIVRVYDAGVLGDGRAFYAMERVRGRSLEVVIEEAKTLRERLALLPHAIAVADAIAYAHSEGVLHRDLKPSNVLIGPFGETVVIDWGLAKDVRVAELPPQSSDSDERRRHESNGSGDGATPQLTQHGALLGTPSYMAPEQARGEASDERSDIYALGALLYTVLTGSAPYRGRSIDEVIDLVAAGKRLRIDEREPALPPELAAIVEHAMAQAPGERFASAKDLADELRAYAAGKLVASHTYSLGQLLRRWVKRYRITLTVAAVALVIVALVGVLAINNVMHERDVANTERLKAEAAQDRANTRYDALLYGLAKQALSVDPSHAAAWLKLMSDRGLSWDKTQQVAAQAAQLGLARELRGHTQDVEHVLVTPDGKYVITGSDDGTARVWKLADGSFIELKGHDGPIEEMTLSSDGRWLATGGTDGDVRLWEIPSGAGRVLRGHRLTVRGVAFSPDSTKLVSTSEDANLYVWDVTSGTGHAVFKHTAGLRPVVWVDNTSVVVGGYDGKVGRYDVVTSKGTMVQAHDAEIRCLALSPDKQRMLVGDEDGVVALWTSDGKRVRTLGRHTDVARDVLFTPDGKHALSAGGDDVVRVYPMPDGAAIELKGNENGIKGLAIDSAGTLVASAGLDNTVRVWSIDGTPLHTFLGTNDAVKSVAFTPDRRLVSGSENNIARIWRLDPIDPPPPGPAMRQWLATHTNVEEQKPDESLSSSEPAAPSRP